MSQQDQSMPGGQRRGRGGVRTRGGRGRARGGPSATRVAGRATASQRPHVLDNINIGMVQEMEQGCPLERPFHPKKRSQMDWLSNIIVCDVFPFRWE